MSEKSKKVQLDTAMTWNGVNYAPGVNQMPEEGANYALKRKFGTSPDESDAELPEDFEPLSRDETMDRFTKGDTADIVFQSLRFHQGAIAEERAKSDPSLGGNKTQNGLPENFPMRHIFEKLGFESVEAVQAKTREELIGMDGIGETTADKALAYGK